MHDNELIEYVLDDDLKNTPNKLCNDEEKIIFNLTSHLSFSCLITIFISVISFVARLEI